MTAGSGPALQHVDDFLLPIEQVTGDEGKGIRSRRIIETKNDGIGRFVERAPFR